MWKLVEVSLIHDGCWSELSAYHVGELVGNLSLMMYPITKKSDASVFVKSGKESDFLEMKQALKASKSVVKLNNISKVSVSRSNEIHYINFMGIYDGTIATILYESLSPFYHYYFKNGYEYWTFIARSNEHFNEVVKKIKEVSTIKSMETKIIDAKKIGYFLVSPIIQFLNSYLTQIQLNSVSLAYRRGYYDIPHQTTIPQLSKVMNISPSTASQRLSSSEKKIMELLFSFNF